MRSTFLFPFFLLSACLTAHPTLHSDLEAKQTNSSQNDGSSSINTSHLERRTNYDDDWEIQRDAPLELVQLSVPKHHSLTTRVGSKLVKNFVDYIYPKPAGEGIFIYVLDLGVNSSRIIKGQDHITARDENDPRSKVSEQELPETRLETTLQTRLSKKNGAKPFGDDDRHSHGTIVAIKAAGKIYGASKKSTIVSIKMALSDKGSLLQTEILESMDIAAQDVETKKRQRKSIIIMSFGTNVAMPLSDSLTKAYHSRVDKLQNLEAPVVTAARNSALDPSLINIHGLPATLAALKVPISVIGEAALDGTLAPYSQRGPLLTGNVATPGGSSALDKNGVLQRNLLATSYAAPIWAGTMANLMSTPKFMAKTRHMSNRESVSYLWEHLATEMTWEPKGNKILYNGVTEDVHRHFSTTC